MSANQTTQQSSTRIRLLDGAHQLATVGDRWFLACVRALSSVTGFARREAGLERSGAGPKRLAADGKRATTIPASDDGDRDGAERLDVLMADDAQPGDSPGAARPPVPSEPAGVLPLLRALGGVVSQHSHNGYRSLQTDDRFWALVDLIHWCTRESRESAMEEGPDDPDPGIR